MKKAIQFSIALSAMLIISIGFTNTAFAFEWTDRGLTVTSRDQVEDGTRVFLQTAQQKSFVVVYGKNLLTDPVKESILAVFKQIQETYNLPTTNIEFKIKPGLFQVNLVLSQTTQVIGITNHGLAPSETLIPTISSMVNEFSTWQGLTIRNLQFVAQNYSFQTVVAPEQGSPIINLNFTSAQPQKKIISDLADFYNRISNWKGFKASEIEIEIGGSSIHALIKEQAAKMVELTYRSNSFNKTDLNKIDHSVNTIAGWNDIDFKQIMITGQSGVINSVVTLNKAVYKGKNLVPNLPTGFRFFYDKDLAFNFRVTSEQYFVEVKGDYSNEDKFLWQINEAVKDPILYIQKYDPEFFFRQLVGINNRNAQAYNELKDDQQKAYKELLAKHEKLKQAHDRFIYGFITMENSGFMGTADINKAAINRIVELKTSNNEYTRDQLETELKKENIDISDKVVDMVLNLYFNDFK